jgi:hypothetical protein
MTEVSTEQRTMQAALADLRARYERQPRGDLARMVQQLEAEIAIRKKAGRRQPA